MKISKQLKLQEYTPGEYLSIGERRSYNNRIIKCIVGSGFCSGNNREGSCVFCGKNECINATSMNCTSYIRSDKTTIALIYDD